MHITIEDAGVRLDPGIGKARRFDAFYTTKETALGMDLSVSRSVHRHGGKL